MDRRTLLKLLAAAALAGCGGRTEARHLRVVVAGAGIVGASIAYHLARAGAAVTVIDRQGPATHASRGTFAWVNATWAKQPRHYHRLNQDGLANWHELQKQLKLPVRWGGSLEWFDDQDRHDRLGQQIAEQVAWGEPARMIGASEIVTLEPKLEVVGARSAAFSPNDGALDPVASTRALLAAAQQLGANVTYPGEVTGAATSGGRLVSVETSGGSIAADRLVLATGAAQLPGNLADLQIPQRSTPGVIAITRPMPRVINRIIVAPGVHMHQRGDGRVVLGEQAGPPDNEAHANRLEGRPNDFPSELFARQHGERILNAARRFVPALAEARIDTAFIGWRPLPLDGHPVLGANPEQPDVYLAVMHSGVSLAPIVGQLVAYEIVEDAVVDQLAQYRPTRSFETVRRY